MKIHLRSFLFALTIGLVHAEVLLPLNVEDSLAAFEIAPHYQIEAVASEPQLEEPVLAVWDGNGAMYVAEMRSYMQDTEGTATKTARNGRIKRFEDTNDDGSYDRVTVFIDDLNLPRMILPLDERIAVVETDSTAVKAYRDTNGDGVADQQELLWEGKTHDAKRSVEHQDSGLIWNIDNRIYVSYGYRHYRYTDGTWQKHQDNYIWAQWGLDHDETGQVFYSTNSEPFFSGQMPRHYWSLITHRGGKLPREAEPVSFGRGYDLEFLQMKNICPIDDRGREQTARRGMTSAGGQSIYKGSHLPTADLKSFFITDPTAHVVRRGLITDKNGKRFLEHPHGQDEFLISSDLYFRPVNTHTGPDGGIYIVDMARGIIQDAPWLNENDRQFINEKGLSKVKRRGRIWRVSHKDYPLSHRKPKMLNQNTIDLVPHLSHPSAWWRLTAQRLIILREDREKAVPFLQALVRSESDPLARLHALWTLEGMGLNHSILPTALRDSDWRVRAAAVRQHESTQHFAPLEALLQDPHPEVAKQLILTLGWSQTPAHLDWIGQVIEQHPTHLGVALAGTVALWKTETPTIQKIRSGEFFTKIRDEATRQRTMTHWKEALAQWDRGLDIDSDIPEEQIKIIEAGEVLYFKNCVSCHGSDGAGIKLKGMSNALAPSLVDSKRVKGSLEGLLPVFINGLMGPIEGQTYQAGYMAPAKAMGIERDDRLAELVSYIRYAWGNKQSGISKEEVKKIRLKHKARTAPWTDEELKALQSGASQK